MWKRSQKSKMREEGQVWRKRHEVQLFRSGPQEAHETLRRIVSPVFQVAFQAEWTPAGSTSEKDLRRKMREICGGHVQNKAVSEHGVFHHSFSFSQS